MSLTTAMQWVDKEQFGGNARSGSFAGGIPSPRGTAATNSGFAQNPIGNRVSSEPSNMKQQGVSALRVRPLPDNHHQKVIAATPMFLLDALRDISSGVFTALPFYIVNFHLEDRVRQLPSTKRGRDADSAIVSYKKDDEFTSKFPVKLNESFDRLSYHGFMGAKLPGANQQQQNGGYFPQYNQGLDSQFMMFNFAVNGEVDMPNMFGAVQSGDEVGLMAVMCDSVNNSFVSPDGAIISKSGTSAPFIQILFAWRRNGQSPQTAVRFNSRTDGQTMNHFITASIPLKKLPVLVPNPTLLNPTGTRAGTEADGETFKDVFKPVDFRAAAKFSEAGTVLTSEYQVPVYIKIGNVILTHQGVPSETLIRDAHRSLASFKQLATPSFTVKVKVTPGGGLHKYKKK